MFQTYVRAGSAAVRVNELLALLQTHHVGTWECSGEQDRKDLHVAQCLR